MSQEKTYTTNIMSITAASFPILLMRWPLEWAIKAQRARNLLP
jgi:hypothetical protein